jgi:hypothetical protein
MALCMLILGTVMTQANFDYMQNRVNTLGIFFPEAEQMQAVSFTSFVLV